MFVIEHRIDESRRAITDMVIQLQHNKHLLDKAAKQLDEVFEHLDDVIPATLSDETNITEQDMGKPTTAVQVNELKNSSTPLESSCAPKKLSRLANSSTRTGIPVKNISQPSSARLAVESERLVRSAILSTPTNTQQTSLRWSKK